MKKLILGLLLLSQPVFSCTQCLTYYAEQRLYESELILDDMLESHSEENIPFFFFMLGRNNALYEMRMQIDEPCQAALHDEIFQGEHVYRHDNNCFCQWKLAGD